MPNGNARNQGAKTNRKGQGRRRPRNNGGNMLRTNNKQVAYRTTDQVQNSLAQRNNTHRPIANVNRRLAAILDMHYLRCRLDPLNSTAGGGLNDGLASKKVVFDCRSFGDFTVDTVSQQFIIKIVPWIPYPALIKTGSASTPSGFTVNGVAITAGDPDTNVRWIPLCLTQNSGSVAAGQTPILPFAGGTYRLISMGWKLIYTGSASSCSGILTVKESPVAINSRGPNVSIQNLVTPADVTVTAYAANTVPIATVSSSTAIATLTTDTHECRPEVGCSGVLRHVNNIYRTQAVKNVTELPVSYTNDGVVNGRAFIASPAATEKYGSLSFYDNDYTPVEISGKAVNGSYRLELVQCFEVIPDVSSTAVLVAKQPGKDNRVSQELADQYLAKAPVSIPLGQSHFQRFLQTISSTANIVGPAFGPLGSTIGGGVSAIAGALSSLNL